MKNFIKSNYLKLMSLSAVIFGVSAISANAAVPTATSTLDTLGGTIVATIVDFATIVFTTYWPYALLAIVLTGLIGLGYKMVHIGGGKR